MTTSLIIFLALTLAASVSPLLTFAYLWQIKEWRIDRLVEHFREEGWMRQLFGFARPMILIAVLVLELNSLLPTGTWIALALFLLATLNLIQWSLKRQPTPVWTQKAIAITLLSIVLNTTTIGLLLNFQFSIFNFLLLPI